MAPLLRKSVGLRGRLGHIRGIAIQTEHCDNEPHVLVALEDVEILWSTEQMHSPYSNGFTLLVFAKEIDGTVHRLNYGGLQSQ